MWQPKPSKRDQFLKSADDTLYLGGGKQKSKRRPVVVDDEFELEENGPLARRGAAWQPPQGETPLDGSALFVRWEEMLGSREALKRRLDSIAAVHGWESRCARRSFLGGIEPGVLARSLRVEIDEFGQAAAELERADLLLQLRRVREQLTALEEERERQADDVAQLQEDTFEARALLAAQSEELDRLRQLGGGATPAAGGGESSGASKGAASRASTAEDSAAAADLSIFQSALASGDAADGRRVVEALEQLKLPDEAAMGARELASWRENKKTIVNSLKTLSSQIYSATARIVFELIQNADDCTFADDGRLRELHLECDEDALVAFHNEKGFQPKDLYAMCQVGESSKQAGSGKIGRKGIGFKSTFQITDCPLIVSPPFSFKFDTAARGIFGYIVPSWVEQPEQHVPSRHHSLLRRTRPDDGGGGTLLVCPFASRVRGTDLLRDFEFDGLSLAFLKNLEKISFVSRTPLPTAAGAPRRRRSTASSAPWSSSTAPVTRAASAARCSKASTSWRTS